MLRSLKHLEHYTTAATDGDVGNVVDFLVDDEHWAVRYLVAKTGAFFGGRRVLISPISFRQADWETHSFHVKLTIDDVKRSPDTDFAQTVSRQHEIEIARHYRFPYYWGGAGVWGPGVYPGPLSSLGWDLSPVPGEAPLVGSHLRSLEEVRGYHIVGADGEIGHVSDFIVDDRSWQVRYLAIDTSNWWLGKRVLVAPPWASSISWETRTVHIRKTREAIRNSPPWDQDTPIDRPYESRLHDYYCRTAYWSSP